MVGLCETCLPHLNVQVGNSIAVPKKGMKAQLKPAKPRVSLKYGSGPEPIGLRVAARGRCLHMVLGTSST